MGGKRVMDLGEGEDWWLLDWEKMHEGKTSREGSITKSWIRDEGYDVL